MTTPQNEIWNISITSGSSLVPYSSQFPSSMDKKYSNFYRRSSVQTHLKLHINGFIKLLFQSDFFWTTYCFVFYPCCGMCQYFSPFYSLEFHCMKLNIYIYLLSFSCTADCFPFSFFLAIINKIGVNTLE